jgi:hypothetical protein
MGGKRNRRSHSLTTVSLQHESNFDPEDETIDRSLSICRKELGAPPGEKEQAPLPTQGEIDQGRARWASTTALRLIDRTFLAECG